MENRVDSWSYIEISEQCSWLSRYRYPAAWRGGGMVKYFMDFPGLDVSLHREVYSLSCENFTDLMS